MPLPQVQRCVCFVLWFSLTLLPHSLQLLNSPSPVPNPTSHDTTELRYKHNSGELTEQLEANSSEKIRAVPFRELLQNYLAEFLEHEQQQQGEMSALIWCDFLLNAEWFIKALSRWQVWQPSVCVRWAGFIMLLVLKYLCRNRLGEINYLVHKSILLKAAMTTAISIKLCSETSPSILQSPSIIYSSGRLFSLPLHFSFRVLWVSFTHTRKTAPL